MNKIYRNVDEAYIDLCGHLLGAPEVGNTREINNVKICITNTENPVVSVRDISESYLFGELVWYFAGIQSLDFISRFSKFWEKISDDGITSNSAYGYLIKQGYGFNQYVKMYELLKKDPLSRRAVINLNVPNKNVIETKDEPCTISIQFLLRDDKLNCTVCMRSNDIYLGFPYDVAFFMSLQKLLACDLGVKPGVYTHFVGSMHMYQRNEEAIRQLMDNPICKPVYFDAIRLRERVYDIADAIDTAPREKSKEVLFEQLKKYEVIK